MGFAPRIFPPTTPLPWVFATDRSGDEVGPKHQTAFPTATHPNTPHPPFPVSPPSVAGLFTQGKASEESSRFEKRRGNVNIFWWIPSQVRLHLERATNILGRLHHLCKPRESWPGEGEHLKISKPDGDVFVNFTSLFKAQSEALLRADNKQWSIQTTI